jgi:phosphopantothenoylcysteine decarboxylase/phosphopantothenate--cysteine ligase
MSFDEYREAYLKDVRGAAGDALAGRRVVLAVSGSIAAFECPRLVRELMRQGGDVHVVMSRAARRIVSADTLRWCSGNPVVTRISGWVEHLYLAGEWKGAADLVLVAPATANTVGKIASGIDDTVVTTVATTAIGAGRPVVLAPGMHACMARHPAFVDNLERLREWGVTVVEPRVAEGKAKMAPIDAILDAVVSRLGKRDLEGRRVLITAGPTIEHLDPVRVVTNLSSGKMGVALAQAALDRGARVTLVYGPGSASPPTAAEVIRVRTTAEMDRAVQSRLDGCDYAIFSAAPCDFAAAAPADAKVPTREGAWTVELVPTPKIIERARAAAPHAVIVGFKAETCASDEELLARAREAMRRSGADFTVANQVGHGRGFLADENEVWIVGRPGEATHVPRTRKRAVADRILDVVVGSS